MTEIQKLIKKNYASIKKRGLINRKTSVNDFIQKLYEEIEEDLKFASFLKNTSKSFIKIKFLAIISIVLIILVITAYILFV